MKVGYYVSQYPRIDAPADYFWGGTGEAAAGLAEAMAQLGHSVTVLTSSPDNREKVRTQNGVRVVECPSWGNLSQARIAPSILWAGLRSDFDLVHAHAGNPPAPFGALLYHLVRDVPLAVTCHGDPMAEFGGILRQWAVRMYQGRPLQFLFERADVLFVPSITFLEDSRFLGRIRRHVEELPNGISYGGPLGSASKIEARKGLGIPSNAKVVLSIGSLNPYKDPHTILEAGGLLHHRESDVIVLFVGDGPLRNSLKRRAQALDLGESVRFDGLVDHARISDYLAAADVFVMPSMSEVFPISLLEAFGAGLPVVVSDLRTFAGFVVEDVNGLIVPRGDPGALFQAVLSILEDDGLRIRLGTGAFATARQFDWKSVASRAENRYKEILDK